MAFEALRVKTTAAQTALVGMRTPGGVSRREELRAAVIANATIVRTPESPSNDRSCAMSVPSSVSHQSRARKCAITPSRFPPCQTSTPPGCRTRANS